MFSIECLTKRFDEETARKLSSQYKFIVEDYFTFLCSIIDDEKLKNKFKAILNDTICYIVDKKTLIPRNLNGKDKSFFIPYRAVSFVREQFSSENNPNVEKIKNGIAIFFNEKNVGIICHEMNHAYAKPLEIIDQEGTVVKSGLLLQKQHNDKLKRITGDLLDEGITDAIAKYYHENYKDNLEEVCGPQSPYRAEYDTLTQVCEILLGKDLSNKSLLNAYFGDVEALKLFMSEFDEIMKEDNITFRDLLKSSWKYEDCIDGVNYSDVELTYYFSKYQIKKCKDKEQLEETKEWLLEKGINVDNLQKLRQMEMDK